MENPFDKEKYPHSWRIWEKNNNAESPFYAFDLSARLSAKEPNERDIDVYAMYGEGFKQVNIAKFFKLSKARVGQIIANCKKFDEKLIETKEAVGS